MWGFGGGYGGGYDGGYGGGYGGHGCCERPRHGHGGFALIVVLFILLIIIGATMHRGKEC